MKKFWNWIRDEDKGRVLRLEGPIDEDNLWGDEVTPKAFRDELDAEDGDVTVWINSPGGNVFSAAQIYTMLCEHKGKVTVKIDAIAASAASVIAMAGDKVLMSPVSMIMVHDPMTIAMGNAKDMEKAITTLNEVKASIINAYQKKTGLSRNKISQLMEDETWMNAKKAVEMGFADEVMFAKKAGADHDKEEGDNEYDGKEIEAAWKPYSTRIMGQRVLNRIVSSVREAARADEEPVEASGNEENVEQAEEELMEEEMPETAVDIPLADTGGGAALSGRAKPKDADPDEKKPKPEDEPEPDTDDSGEGEPEKDEPEKDGGETDDDELNEPDDPKEKPKPDKGRSADEADKTPVIGLDGRTKDGAMPYEIVRKQLDFLKRG